MRIILSIQPQYVQQIFEGIKKYEYRTRVPKKEIESIIVYETYPTMKVVGELYIDKILNLPIDEMWKQTHEYSCAKKEDLYSYFKDKDNCYAYKISKFVKFDKPKDLKDYGVNFAPQSFVYID